MNAAVDLSPSDLCNPLRRMEIRFDGVQSEGGLRTVNAARFGMVRNRGTRPHQGVDLHASVGTPVYAIADGEVCRIRRHDPYYGQELLLRFQPDSRSVAQVSTALPADGILYALYAHLSLVAVTLGPVKKGQRIGLTGVSGNADQRYPHLHFEVRTMKDAGFGLQHRIDPEQMFQEIDYSKPLDALAGWAKTA